MSDTTQEHAVRAPPVVFPSFRLLVEALPEAIAVHRKGRIVYVNPAGMALIGAERGDTLVGRRAMGFVHHDDLPLLQQRLGAPASRLQYRLKRLDGEASSSSPRRRSFATWGATSVRATCSRRR